MKVARYGLLPLLLLVGCITVNDESSSLDGVWYGESEDGTERVAVIFNGNYVKVIQMVKNCTASYGGNYEPQSKLVHRASFNLVTADGGNICFFNSTVLVNGNDATGKHAEFCYGHLTFPDSSQYFLGLVNQSGNTLQIRTKGVGTTCTTHPYPLTDSDLSKEGDILSIHTKVTTFTKVADSEYEFEFPETW